MNWKDIGVRAAKTAIQTAIAYAGTASMMDFSDQTWWVGMAVTSGSAGLSVVNNVLVQYRENAT